MKILYAGHNFQPRQVTTINGYTLKICKDFLYLCVSIKTLLHALMHNICRAWFAIGKLSPSFISKISDANKMRLLSVTAETIVALRQESVPMTPSLCRQIDASHRRMVRSVFGTTWPKSTSQYIATVELTQWAKLSRLSPMIHMRRLCLVGHIKVSSTNRHIINDCSFELPHPAGSWSNFDALTLCYR